MTSFTIDENYVITAITIDGITTECHLQINEDWEPYVEGYNISFDNTTISNILVGDENDSTNWVWTGDCVPPSELIQETDAGEYVPLIPTPEVNLVYMGTKYNYIKVWDGDVWLTDRTIGNKLWDTDGDGHLNYTINYLPVHIQFVQVNEEDYSVVSESTVYTADHNGTWAIYDDGHWERLDNKGGKE